MSSDDNLPVILVSAVDTAAALAIIRELISDDAEPPQSNGVGSHEGDAEREEAAEGEGEGVVWRLENKYYTARVRLLPCGERVPRPPDGDAHAHLIYLTADECADSVALSRRVAWVAERRLARGAVRLAGARCAEPPPALQAAALAARYELVPLPAAPQALAPPAEPAEPFPELQGAARLREALHAHPWPGLRRRGAVGSPRRFAEDSSSAESSGDESWGSWRRAGDGGEAGAVERAEQFAAALALLPAARGGAGDAGEGEGEGDAARRLRAEQLVAAFCRALGHNLGGDGGTE